MCKLKLINLILLIIIIKVVARQTEERKYFTEKNNCRETFTSNQALIESPGYPGGYPDNSDCVYVFEGPVCPTYFKFQFLDFNLIPSPGCVRDRLEIHKQEVLCETTTGVKSYFSENGSLFVHFQSDKDTSGRGFKILTTRSPCIKTETTKPTSSLFEVTTRIPPTSVRGGSTLPFCCETSYNAKHFYLTNPGFPYAGKNVDGDCVYRIYRANSDVCRLRIHFLFFYHGEQDANLDCTQGYLQVDGKYICGCRIGLKLISPFDSRWGNDPKEIRFRNRGFSSNPFNGFVLEFIQDECPKRIVPTGETNTKRSEEPRFYFYKDQINRVSWPQSTIQKARLVKENTEVLDADGSGNPVVTNVYVFESPTDCDDGNNNDQNIRDIEETTYLDTSLIGKLRPEGHDNHKCRNWGELKWMMLTQGYLSQKLPKCNQLINNPINYPHRPCEQANFIQGFIQTPGFPLYYPAKLNLCYRFVRQRGYCGIRLFFDEFNLPNSFECRKDYLVLGDNYRYCGRSLHNSVVTLDLRYKPNEEIYFISHSYSCGRGFKAIYEQIPCKVSIIPPNPEATTPFPPITSPPNPETPCSRDIYENIFTIEVFDYNQPRCVFNVKKLDSSVCKLSLALLDFNLQCNSEYLVINNRRYCGPIGGQTLNIDFDYNQLPIIYERLRDIPAVTRLRFRLKGRQINNGCDYPTVPAERFLNFTNDTSEQIATEPVGNKYENQFDKICGVILNSTDDAVLESLCNFFRKTDNTTECIEIQPKTIYVPYHVVPKFDLFAFDSIDKLEVNQITCDDVQQINEK